MTVAVASGLLLNFLPHSIPTGAEDFLQSFGPTFSTYLNQTVGEVFPGVGFVVVPLAFEDVWPAVSEATVDFLFLNPSSASCMERQGYIVMCICCNALCVVMFVRVPLFTVCFSHRVSW